MWAEIKKCGTLHTCGTDFPAVAELTVALECAQVVRARPAILARAGATLVTLYGTHTMWAWILIYNTGSDRLALSI